MSEQIALNVDCMEYMKTLKDNAFDLAIVDPPYGIGVGSMAYTNGVARVGKALADRTDYSGHSEWDANPPSQEYFDELFRVSKRRIIWGGNYFADKLPPTKSWIVWDKRCDNEMSNSFADCELAWGSDGVARVFRFVWNGMLQGNMKDKEKRFHPTQKPVALYEWLLTRYAKAGDRILDTHLGSGSSRIACYKLDFDFVGCEIDKEYFEKQEERFNAFTAQANLFQEMR